MQVPDIPVDFDSWENDKMIDYHLASMEKQLHQIGKGLALAVALNRTVVLPKVCAWSFAASALQPAPCSQRRLRRGLQIASTLL